MKHDTAAIMAAASALVCAAVFAQTMALLP